MKSSACAASWSRQRPPGRPLPLPRTRTRTARLSPQLRSWVATRACGRRSAPLPTNYPRALPRHPTRADPSPGYVQSDQPLRGTCSPRRRPSPRRNSSAPSPPRRLPRPPPSTKAAVRLRWWRSRSTTPPWRRCLSLNGGGSAPPSGALLTARELTWIRSRTRMSAPPPPTGRRVTSWRSRRRVRLPCRCSWRRRAGCSPRLVPVPPPETPAPTGRWRPSRAGCLKRPTLRRPRPQSRSPPRLAPPPSPPPAPLRTRTSSAGREGPRRKGPRAQRRWGAKPRATRRRTTASRCTWYEDRCKC
mmetsp:Transcript_21465/g.53061  ORF Transcript_21465/g.53061 Transcript_21465/m.53061 type:complete len:302 (+) Transcript_21465:4491-5396(+)